MANIFRNSRFYLNGHYLTQLWLRQHINFWLKSYSRFHVQVSLVIRGDYIPMKFWLADTKFIILGLIMHDYVKFPFLSVVFAHFRSADSQNLEYHLYYIISLPALPVMKMDLKLRNFRMLEAAVLQWCKMANSESNPPRRSLDSGQPSLT